MKQRYPIGIQDFASLRQDEYLYIDKTRQLFELVQSGKYFFLSRPRRFGKSLLLSTLKCFFQGQKELFRGLWVEQADYQWPAHPVLHISFSTLSYKDIGLDVALNQAIDLAAQSHGFTLNRKGLGQRFAELIQTLGKGPQKLVILIDEYDKPLIDYIEDMPQAEANRDTLKNFFSVIKDSDPFIRFFFITGVSKFSKVSLFSDLNHLEDLTINPLSATLVGYTQAEVEHYFANEITALQTASGKSHEDTLAEIRRWYNGYRWWGSESLYNPFSVLNLMKSGQFINYWWESGTPSFLIKLLRNQFRYNIEQVDAGSDIFDSYTLESIEWKSLMFQTGYLTIQGYDPDVRLYTLGYPNQEVRDSMYRYLLGAFREDQRSESLPLTAYIKRALDAGDMPRLMELIDTLFATIPHQIFDARREGFFHAVLHLTFQGLGLLTQSEVSTAKGRVDTVVHSRSGIYVMEFKLDEPAAADLSQIREKRYGTAFLTGNQPVTAVGISFSSESRSVAQWEAMSYVELMKG